MVKVKIKTEKIMTMNDIAKGKPSAKLERVCKFAREQFNGKGIIIKPNITEVEFDNDMDAIDFSDWLNDEEIENEIDRKKA